MTDTILVTGGAGFIGSSLAIVLKDRHPASRILCLDNLKRRGAALNLPRLAESGVEFIHGDIRNPGDLVLEGMDIDAIVECSAEPSVLAGYGESPLYTIETNLTGVVNCLELARVRTCRFLFLSSSRVYPYTVLQQLLWRDEATRFVPAENQPVPGIGARGVSEAFPLEGTRSLYGASKLSAELLIHEYAAMYGIPTVIDRCGVVTGPWQMGTATQGIFAFWLAAHHYKQALRYIGFGGTGKQVRDLLHVDDLCELVDLQLSAMDRCRNQVFNVGGGLQRSLSLQETTALCEEITGNRIAVAAEPDPRPADIPWYVTDCSRIEQVLGWKPRRSARETLQDIHGWIRSNDDQLASIFFGTRRHCPDLEVERR